MRMFFQLAAVVALTGAMGGRAQIVSPDKLVAPPPRAPEIRRHDVSDNDLQWLWQFAQPVPTGKKFSLLADARFPALLRDALKAPQAMWGVGVPLGDAARTFLGGEGVVASADNRYLTVSGCVVDHCDQRGLLWVDLGQREPLMVFAGLRWNEEGKIPGQAGAPFTLWLFPARALDAHQLPDALKLALEAWVEGDGCKPYQISNAIVVDPSGVPHVIGSMEAGVQPAICARPTGTH